MSDADDEVLRGRARHRRRDARGRAARAHGRAHRQHRALRAVAARAPRARRHRTQRRLGAHARRLRARPFAVADAGVARRQLPPRRRVRVARERPRARRSRAAGARGRVGADVARRRCRRWGCRVDARGSSTTRVGCPNRRRGTAKRRAQYHRDRARALARFVEELADDLDRRAEHVVGARRVGARPDPALGRRRAAACALVAVRAGGRRAGSRRRSTGSAASTRSRRARRSRCSAARSRSSSTPRAIRSGRLGEGVLVGSAALALGVELDRVWVCGLAEGVFPAPPRDDPLLADADREALGGEMPKRSDRLADDQRALLAALAEHVGARVMCFPRGDLRRSTEHVPSRFLLDTVEALSGTRAARGRSSRRAVVHRGPVVRARAHARVVPATRHELDVRAALAGRPADRRRPRSRARPGARARAAGAPRSPASTATSPHLGDAAGRQAARPAPGSRCRRPGSRRGRSARTRTSCSYVLARRSRSSGPRRSCSSRRSTAATSCTRCSTASSPSCIGVRRRRPAVERRAPRPAARRSCARRFADVEARGVDRPAPAVGAVAPAAARASSTRSSTSTATYRAEHGAETIATELAFGRGRRRIRPIEIKCSDGRTVRIIGSIDRVDRFADGRLAVIDYKSGSHDGVQEAVARRSAARRHDAAAPDLRARGARRCSATPATSRSTRRTGSCSATRRSRAATSSTPPVEEALDRALRVIVDGIDARASSPRRPPEPGWQHVRRVPVLRSRRSRHHRHAPRVAAQARARPSSPTTSSSIGDGPVSRRDRALADRRRRATRCARGSTRRCSSRRARAPARPPCSSSGSSSSSPPTGPTFRCRCAASPRSRSPRRPRPSCATACGASSRRARGAGTPSDGARPVHAGARRARRRRDLHVALVRAADPHRVPGRGRAAAAHRGPRRSVVAARRSTSAGAEPATTCSTIPSSSRRCWSCSRRAPRPSTCAGSRSTSTTTGTCSIASSGRRELPALDLDALARRISTRCARRAITAPTTTTSCSRTSRELEEYARPVAGRGRRRRAHRAAARRQAVVHERHVGARRELARRRR